MNLTITVKMTLVLLVICSGFAHITSAARLRYFSNISYITTIWTDAFSQNCNTSDSFATIYDKEDEYFIINVMSPFSKDNDTSYWIGLTKKQCNVSTWSNGSRFNLTNVTNVTNTEQICFAIANDTWKRFNCSEGQSFMCYKDNEYFLIEKKKNWCQAQQYCRTHYTDLVSIMDSEQNNSVIAKGNNKTFWIGLMIDEWEWHDNSCSTYRPKFGSGGECTSLSKNRKFVVSGSGNVKQTICSRGSVRIIVVNISRTWENASDYCMNHHTRLLQIEDGEDQYAVEQKLNNTDVNGTFWIGLRQSRVFGFWIWSDRTVREGNWKSGRPPEMHLSDTCGLIDKEDKRWIVKNCEDQFPFLCEEKVSFMKTCTYY